MMMGSSARLSLKVSTTAAAAALALALDLQAAPQQPVFRAGVDHVAVDVIATDSHDRRSPT